jgi:acetoin utilization deacetylase AcuC-like enzyme
MLERCHPPAYIQAIKESCPASGIARLDADTWLSPGSWEAMLRGAGAATHAVDQVMSGRAQNAFAAIRPPGHHAEQQTAMGFCFFNNAAIAARHAQAVHGIERVAIIDWDVHHGNGTEAIFYDRDDVLTISIHQDRNYPTDSGAVTDRGKGAGEGFNINIPLPPGTGHKGYLATMERLALPAIRAYRPDVLIVACGFDAAINDPLGRMLATAETFRLMTRQVMALAAEVCGSRLVLVHEGGYSEAYVPFCGHAVLQELSGSAINAPDPHGDIFTARQPWPLTDVFVATVLDDLARSLGLP